MSSETENLEQAGQYCPGCGYDLRGLTSGRCPECGLEIDRTRSGMIPWESRGSLGYFRSFFRTLIRATIGPVKLARATGSPLDLRSAALFRWIVRALVFLPCLGLFIYSVNLNEGPDHLAVVNGSTRGTTDRFWESQFLWSVGATCWPVLPIGFLITLIFSTGVSHWFCMRHQELVRRNRSMIFSFYMCSPLTWIFIPAASESGLLYLSTQPNVSESSTLYPIWLGLEWTTGLSLFFILLAVLNQLRAVSAATTCGIGRSLLVGLGVLFQCALSIAIGLGLFPVLAGIIRLIYQSLAR